MSETTTLEFESARSLAALFANDVRLLKTAEESLDVKLTTREGWLRIEGETEGVERVRQLFQQLEKARTSGLTIRKPEFAYALRAVTSEGVIAIDELAETKIQCSPRRPPVIPKTEGQRAYLRAIQAHDLVFGLGPAGTGKTYLAMAMAVSALKKEEVTRIILTRPAVEAGEALGFLPGDLNEKIMPYLRPLYDALHDMIEAEELQRLIDRGVIEVAPLAYMRGRTLNHSFVVLDEAQNTTTEQMFMFLTRLGSESKAVVTGDATQIDLPVEQTQRPGRGAPGVEGRGGHRLLPLRGARCDPPRTRPVDRPRLPPPPRDQRGRKQALIPARPPRNFPRLNVQLF